MAGRTHRRLAGILAADVVGYSRLMGADETGTLDRLKSYRVNVVEPAITEHRGRIVKLMGDGLLAEFPSVIETVQCAVDVQQAMKDSEAETQEDRRIQLRIGVNLGDIIVEGSDIYGDGVNVAARLESIADPGGICISAIAFDTVDGRLDLTFEDMGLQALKNIDKPVRVYRLAGGDGAQSVDTSEFGTLALPDKPSIAVLPFTNMSRDPEQEFFSDGISEDIITELSRFRSLFVVARNSSFQFRGDSVDVRKVGQQLGVYYVLEGSVRKAGDRIRVTAQLIDATTNEHVWAERYDGSTEDIFDLQDDISRKIVSTIAGRLDDTHAERLSSRTTKDYNAYEHVLRGQKWMQKYALDEYAKARTCFEAAIASDPQFARAHACLGLVAFYEWNGTADPALIDEAFACSETALQLDPHESRCHLALGVAHMFRAEHDKADYHLKRGIRTQSQRRPDHDREWSSSHIYGLSA